MRLPYINETSDPALFIGLTLRHYDIILQRKAAYKGTRILLIKVITKLPNSEQSYKGKVQTHNYINRQNQSTTGKL